MQEELGIDALFVGQRYNRLAPLFRIGRDVYVHYFVILRPNDNDNCPFWIARALTNVDAEPIQHLHSVLIHY